jgi:hypothetical protein
VNGQAASGAAVSCTAEQIRRAVLSEIKALPASLNRRPAKARGTGKDRGQILR